MSALVRLHAAGTVQRLRATRGVRMQDSPSLAAATPAPAAASAAAASSRPRSRTSTPPLLLRVPRPPYLSFAAPLEEV